MDKAKFNQMIHAQETAHSNAWKFITSSWHTSEWTTIPQGIRYTLNLPSSLGMYSGMLISKPAADGARDFIRRMNNRKVN